jgi:Lhr-like helicase
MGLYDGMMNETRAPGQRLPGRANFVKKRKARAASASPPDVLQTHPYSLAVSLGKQIRFSAPLEQIAAELEAVAPKALAQAGR